MLHSKTLVPERSLVKVARGESWGRPGLLSPRGGKTSSKVYIVYKILDVKCSTDFKLLSHVKGNLVSYGEFLQVRMLFFAPNAENLATPLVTDI
jgi:hypothetical protein